MAKGRNNVKDFFYPLFERERQRNKMKMRPPVKSNKPQRNRRQRNQLGIDRNEGCHGNLCLNRSYDEILNDHSSSSSSQKIHPEEVLASSSCLNTSECKRLGRLKKCKHFKRNKSQCIVSSQCPNDGSGTRCQGFVTDLLTLAPGLAEQLNILALVMKREMLGADDLLVRGQICQQLNDKLNTFYKGSKVYPCGSSVTGFGWKKSEELLTLDVIWAKTESQKFKNLRIIAFIMRDSTDFYSPFTLTLKNGLANQFRHRASNLQCFLNINDRLGLKRCQLLRLYSKEARVRRLVYYLLLWARSQHLVTVGYEQQSSDSFTEYAFILIVLFYVMQASPPIIPLVWNLDNCVAGVAKEIDEWECMNIPEDAELPGSVNTQSDVELLQGFFTFYCQQVAWDNDALCVRDGTKLQKNTLLQDLNFEGCQIGSITVLDPYELNKNVTSNVTNAFRMKFSRDLKFARSKICEPSQCSNQYKPWGVAALLDCKQIPALNSLIECPSTWADAELDKIDQKKLIQFVVKPRQATLQKLKQNKKSPQVRAVIPNYCTLNKMWRVLVENQILEILRKVFLAEVTPVGLGPAAVKQSLEDVRVISPRKRKHDYDKEERSSKKRKVEFKDNFSQLQGINQTAFAGDRDKKVDNFIVSIVNKPSCQDRKVYCRVRHSSTQQSINSHSFLPNRTEQKRLSNRGSDNDDDMKGFVRPDCGQQFSDRAAMSSPSLPECSLSASVPTESPSLKSASSLSPRNRDKPHSFICRCPHAVWSHRDQLHQEVKQQCCLDGLKLEEVSTKIYLQNPAWILEGRVEEAVARYFSSSQMCHEMQDLERCSESLDPKPFDLEFVFNIEHGNEISTYGAKKQQVVRIPYFIISFEVLQDGDGSFSHFYKHFQTLVTSSEVTELGSWF